MSAITLLSAGAKADSGVGAAFDVSAGSTLRLDAAISADFGTVPVLMIAIETAPTATGPWTQVASRRFAGHLPASSTPWPSSGVARLVTNQLDQFARVTWSGQAGNVSNNSPTDSTAKFNIGVTGTLT